MPRILIIDDDDTLRDVLVEYFESMGFGVIEAPNGRIALEKQMKSPVSEEARGDIQDALQVEKRRAETLRRNVENMDRCAMKLDTLGSFLDHLAMTVENLRTVQEEDAFERFEGQVSREIEDLERVCDRAMKELFTAGLD